MRLASRIIGVLLVIAGLGFFAALGYGALTEGWRGATVGLLAFFLAAGAGLLLGGRYYLRVDPETPDEVESASTPTLFLITHRRELKVLAQVGLVLSVIRLGSACFGIDWPGRWADWPLLLLLLALLYFGRKMASPDVPDNADWMRVPGWIRRSLPRVSTALWVAALLSVFTQLWPSLQALPENPIYHLMIRLLFLAGMTMFYAEEVLFFTYGELKRAPIPDDRVPG
jgi:hypothetical protein